VGVTEGDWVFREGHPSLANPKGPQNKVNVHAAFCFRATQPLPPPLQWPEGTSFPRHVKTPHC